jgi:integrase
VFVTEEEFRAILQHLSDDIAPVATFMYWTGWRTSEVLSLKWDQVDFIHGVLRLGVGTTKNDDGREFPFHALPELEALLRRQRERAARLQDANGQAIPWVFFWSVRHAKEPAGRPIKNFLDGWHTACRKAGIDDRRVPHDFRRTTVRRYERANVARSLATALTGHRTESVYRRYAITSTADKTEALAKVAALASPNAVMGRIDESRKVSAKSGRRDGWTASTGET